MRKNLLETLDKIYIIDLHGNTKKKKPHLMVGKDENVLDIVCKAYRSNIFIKTGKKQKDWQSSPSRLNLEDNNSNIKDNQFSKLNILAKITFLYLLFRRWWTLQMMRKKMV